MSDSDDRLNEAIEDLRPLAEQVEAGGEPQINGTATVEFAVGVDGARTPLEAVEMVVQRIVHHGLSSVIWGVTDDETDQVFAVQDGRVVPMSELEEIIERVEAVVPQWEDTEDQADG